MHVAGEHPPELSPLDAFALQSRLLAKQLEESAKNGNRLSRLPPLTTDSPLIVQGRSEYFRSLSAEASSEAGDVQQHSVGPAQRAELEDSPIRPQSMHPRMSQIPPTPDSSFPMPTPNSFEQLRGRTLGPLDERSSYFGARRERSPSSFDSVSIDAKLVDEVASEQQELAAGPQITPSQALASPNKLVHKTSHESLAPPKTVFPKRTSSVLSQPVEVISDDVMGSSFHSSHGSRKLSTSSASVFSPYQQRSPSISSNISELPRPALNFSRPMSRAGTPGPMTPALETPSRFDPPVRQASSDSHSSIFAADDAANTPISMNSEDFPDMHEDGKPGAASYIYSKYSLPRGKMIKRASLERGQPGPAFKWEQPIVGPSNVQTVPYVGQAPPSPPTRPSSSRDGPAGGAERPSASLDVPRPSTQPSPSDSRPSTSEGGALDDLRGRPRPATATTSDASTIKAKSQHSVANTMAETPADEHVNMAISLHEEGKLNESTYHLRYAAKQGHLTGMLLYALACRHGWGMRANQQEGVKWLQKAADSAGLEIATDESNAKVGQRVDKIESRTHKAQLALSIYELGVSHMNGWGTGQDKALAVRCFEIAGSKLRRLNLQSKGLI